MRAKAYAKKRTGTYKTNHRTQTSFVGLEKIRKSKSDNPGGDPEHGGTDGKVLLTVSTSRHLGRNDPSERTPRKVKGEHYIKCKM